MASAVVGVGLVVGFACLAVAGVRRLSGVTLRADESLALGAALILVTGVAGYLLALATGFPLNGLSITLAVTGSIGTLVGAYLLHRALREEGLASIGRSLWLGVVVAIVSVVAVLVAGYDFLYATNYQSDPVLRTDAVKELVWSDSANSLDNDPLLTRDNRKYAGYLAGRAAVTKLAGDDPSQMSLAWILICAIGMGTVVFALARNLGLPAWAAGVATAAVPVLGGDAYRLSVVGEPRAAAMIAMLAGLMLLARAVRSKGAQRTWLALVGGGVAGAAGVIHVQYVLIVTSVLAPLFLVALVLGRALGDLWRPIATACVAMGVVMLLAIPQVKTFDTATLAEASAERTREEASGKRLVESGEAVWPPRIVSVSDTDVLYAAPWLYSLSPAELFDSVWGERTTALLALAGVLAAFAVRRRTSPLLLALLIAAVLVPLLVQFNPLVFPIFTSVFSSYRAEYIGFEFGFLAIAAVALALALVRRRQAIPIAAVALAASVPVLVDNFDWHRFHYERNESRYESEFVEAVKHVRDSTRHTDLVITRKRFWPYTSTALPQRTVIHPRQAKMPSPFSPRAGSESVRKSLGNIRFVRTRANDGLILLYPRVVVLVDEAVSRKAPIRRLLSDGGVRRLSPGANEPGVYVVFAPYARARAVRSSS